MSLMMATRGVTREGISDWRLRPWLCAGGERLQCHEQQSRDPNPYSASIPNEVI
jgi:hypothetical protein